MESLPWYPLIRRTGDIVDNDGDGAISNVAWYQASEAFLASWRGGSIKCKTGKQGEEGERESATRSGFQRGEQCMARGASPAARLYTIVRRPSPFPQTAPKAGVYLTAASIANTARRAHSPVSHNCNLNVRSSVYIVLLRKSIPIVAWYVVSKESYICTREAGGRACDNRREPSAKRQRVRAGKVGPYGPC